MKNQSVSIKEEPQGLKWKLRFVFFSTWYYGHWNHRIIKEKLRTELMDLDKFLATNWALIGQRRKVALKEGAKINSLQSLRKESVQCK